MMIQVLVVEDDLMLAELNRRFIESIEGFRVVAVANDGEKALEILKVEEVDLIILDIYIPKINGMDVFRKLREEKNYIDVILVTASNDADSISEALKLGAVDYLVKPFEFERMKKSLVNYKNRSKLLLKKPFVNQSELDKIFIGEYEEKDESSIRKGLNQMTLNRVVNFLSKNKGAYLSSEHISESLSMSKVTIRRYLEYLEETGKVVKKIDYGTRGRPSYLYKYL